MHSYIIPCLTVGGKSWISKTLYKIQTCDIQNTTGGGSKQITPANSMVYFQQLKHRTTKNKKIRDNITKECFSPIWVAMILQSVCPTEKTEEKFVQSHWRGMICIIIFSRGGFINFYSCFSISRLTLCSSIPGD